MCFWAFAAVCLALLPLPEMKNVPIPAFVLLILGVVGVFGVEGISVSYYLALMGGEKVSGCWFFGGNNETDRCRLADTDRDPTTCLV